MRNRWRIVTAMVLVLGACGTGTPEAPAAPVPADRVVAEPAAVTTTTTLPAFPSRNPFTRP